MKIFFLILLMTSTLFAGAAQAQSVALKSPSLVCKDTSNTIDDGYIVEIGKDERINGGEPKAELLAVVERESISGPRIEGTYSVSRKQDRASGALVYYRGKDFKLMLRMDVKPTRGWISSRLSFQRYHDKIVVEMLCRFYPKRSYR